MVQAVAIPGVMWASDGVGAVSANRRGMLCFPTRLALHFTCFTLRNKTQAVDLFSVRQYSLKGKITYPQRLDLTALESVSCPS